MFFPHISALFDSSGPYLASVAPIWLRSPEVTKISLAVWKDRLPTKRVSRPPAGVCIYAHPPFHTQSINSSLDFPAIVHCVKLNQIGIHSRNSF